MFTYFAHVIKIRYDNLKIITVTITETMTMTMTMMMRRRRRMMIMMITNWYGTRFTTLNILL